MTHESSNRQEVEKLSTKEVIKRIRNAMGEGCIRPVHVHDLVDEALCRLEKKKETAEAKPYRMTVHCDNTGIKVEGARTDIGSTCDTDASDLDSFLRIAEHWWNTYA